MTIKNFTVGCHSPAKEDGRQGYACLGAVTQPNLPCSKHNPASSTCFGVSEQKFNTKLISPIFLAVVRSYNFSELFPLICFPVGAAITPLLNGQELQSPQQLEPFPCSFLFFFFSHVTCHAVIIKFQSSRLCSCFVFLALFSTQ